ncbi:unnamed protein product [Rotaria sp. Silwood2]|nr:unnamed protein product [Rotaria sp. Silwood2]CAF4354306.1 unnamed protein product [Rotaria sp. Silwood2]CAF4434629.1 unnamed protein product [Rotaria sp. Silwood2]
MKFQELANELLLELFEFIDFVYLLRAFYSLNSRFNKLHYRIYHLDFQFVSKCEFHTLSNNDETSNSSELRLSYRFTLHKFYCFGSLSLDCIDSLGILNRIILKYRYLPYFTRLSIINCDFKDEDKFSYLIEDIWKLPKLTYCQINHQFSYRLKYTNDTDTVISLSIETLFLENFNFDLNDTSNLFQYTLSCRQFNESIHYYSECKQLHIIS